MDRAAEREERECARNSTGRGAREMVSAEPVAQGQPLYKTWSHHQRDQRQHRERTCRPHRGIVLAIINAQITSPVAIYFLAVIG